MKRKIITFVSLFVFGCATLFSAGCHSGNNQNPNRGFDVRVTAAGFSTPAYVQGDFLSGAGTYGSLTTFTFPDISNIGFTSVSNAKVPGTWRLTYGAGFSPSLCLGILTIDRNVSLGSQETLPCVPRYYSFSPSPDTIDALNPPATITLNGNGGNSGNGTGSDVGGNLHGTPMLAYYDEFGNMVASSSANQLLYDSNGAVTGVLASVPNISQVYDGIYTAAVYNVNADGTWELNGAATITIYGNPPPNGGGGGDGGCEPQSPDQPQLPCD